MEMTWTDIKRALDPTPVWVTAWMMMIGIALCQHPGILPLSPSLQGF